MGYIRGVHGGDTMRWNTARARRQFADLVRAARQEPVLIHNRDEVVAILVSPATFEEFRAWRAARVAGSFADAFAPLRTLAADDGWALEMPPRRDRPDPMESP